MREKKRNLSKENIIRIRRLRQEMSQSERFLWERLNNEGLGFKFRRQYPIGLYSLDFYCPKLQLCLEVDGEQHEQRKKQDARRDGFLRQQGILTVRIPSLELWGANNTNVIEWTELIRAICIARAEELATG